MTTSPTTTNEYDAQAEAFLKAHGLAMRFDHAGEKLPPWREDDGKRHEPRLSEDQHWRVTILRTAGDQRKRLTFDFYNSIHDTQQGIELRPYSVLSCISSDASYGDDPEEIIRELGFDIDSRREYAQAVAVAKFSARLHRFFSPEELTALQEIQ